MAAMVGRKCLATTLGFSTIDGLVMGTRCGNLDPGVILHLMETKGLGVKEMTKMLYKESGLLGVSGISQDMRTLLASDKPEAQEAVDLFCYRIVRELGSWLPRRRPRCAGLYRRHWRARGRGSAPRLSAVGMARHSPQSGSQCAS
jgi:acetate kinase